MPVLADRAQGFEPSDAVGIAEADALASVTARSDVVAPAGELDSYGAGHAALYGALLLYCKTQSLRIISCENPPSRCS
jgi:hypothetical protein